MGNLGQQPGAAPWLALALQVTAQQAGAFAHGRQAQAAIAGDRPVARCLETLAVILDVQLRARVAAAQADAHAARPGMLENIVDAFLGDTKQGDFHIGRQPCLTALQPLHPVAGVTQAVGLLVEGVKQAEVIEQLRAQAIDGLATLAYAALGQFENGCLLYTSDAADE